MRGRDVSARDQGAAREFVFGAACGLVLFYGMKALRIWTAR